MQANPVTSTQREPASILNRLSNFWNFLTRSHPSITDMEIRRQSRLLAGLLIALITMSVIASFLLTINSNEPGIPDQVIRLWVSLLISCGLYFVNRSGHYRLSASIFLIMNFFTVHVTPIATGDLSWLFFTSMFFILTATLMPLRVTWVVFFISLITQIVLRLSMPMTTTVTNLATTIVFSVTAPLILVFINHRAGLEAERRAELQRANEKLRQSEQILEQRVIERTDELRVAKEEAETARKQAEDANHVKSQFLANMSHELRTPLNAILNFTAFVSDGVLGPVNDEQVDMLQQSISSGKHLLALINDVLDITKIEAGLMDLFIQEVNLNETLDAVVSVGKGLVKDKSIDLITEIETDLPVTYGDKRRLRQVFLNLMSNAVKFTPQGSVTIRAKSQANTICVSVQDTGIGIAAEDQSLVFESFKQAKHDIQESIGTGLGMPISKYFVESHKGKMWLESEIGKGSTFYVELPILTEEEANAISVSLMT